MYILRLNMPFYLLLIDEDVVLVLELFDVLADLDAEVTTTEEATLTAEPDDVVTC
jgi:hypothetical protein